MPQLWVMVKTRFPMFPALLQIAGLGWGFHLSSTCTLLGTGNILYLSIQPHEIAWAAFLLTHTHF